MAKFEKATTSQLGYRLLVDQELAALLVDYIRSEVSGFNPQEVCEHAQLESVFNPQEVCKQVHLVTGFNPQEECEQAHTCLCKHNLGSRMTAHEQTFAPCTLLNNIV